MSKSGTQRLSDSLKSGDNFNKRVCVYDCRFEHEEAVYKWLDISGFDFNDFVDALQQVGNLLLISSGHFSVKCCLKCCLFCFFLA